MKFKLLIYVFASLTVLLCILYYLDIKAHKEIIVNREITITNYQKVIDAIGRAGGVPVHKLRLELQKEFDIADRRYTSFSKEYNYTFFPKKQEVNSERIWTFMGLELVLNEKKEFKTIHLHKP